MNQESFQRARSEEHKLARAQSLMDAARAVARDNGVAAVTLTAVARRAGVHHSAVRRYFDSHKDVLLQLAREGWDCWADAMAQASLDAQVGPTELASLLAETLTADPLFCDLLANVPLHLEHDVDLAQVIAFKRSTHDAVERLCNSVIAAVPGMEFKTAVDIVTAATSMAATLWQATHPSRPLARAMKKDPALSYLGAGDFEVTLTRLLTAVCIGLAADR